MFEKALTEAEVKAVARARNFPGGSQISRSALKNMFLTDIGLEENFSALTAAELATLHLLMIIDSPVDVSFFERTYKEDLNIKEVYLQTFHQQFRDVYKEVRGSLVRKGLLMIYPDVDAGRSVRLEQWRFEFPKAFIPHLPALVHPDLRNVEGEVNEQAVRKKILQLVGEEQDDPLAKNANYQFSIREGSLCWGANSFMTAQMLEWQRLCWTQQTSFNILFSTEMLHPIEAIDRATQGLQSGEWFLPTQLKTVLQVFSFGIEAPAPEVICETGWQWGLLARHEQEKRIYYSPMRLNTGEDQSLFNLLQCLQSNDQGLWVDLRKVPYNELAVLNQMADFQLEGERLLASPNLKKIGLSWINLQEKALPLWLAEHEPQFAIAFQQVRERWGRNILHTGLMIARITDLDLRVQIERAFTAGVDYVRLSEEYLAFRKDLLPSIEKILKKSEHVIKRMSL